MATMYPYLVVLFCGTVFYKVIIATTCFCFNYNICGHNTLHARNERSGHAKNGAGASIGARGMKEKGRGRTVIMHGIHDWEAACHAYVECQLSENGKYVSETSLQWQICRRHSEDGNRVCGNRKDDKYVKNPTSPAPRATPLSWLPATAPSVPFAAAAVGRHHRCRLRDPR